MNFTERQNTVEQYGMQLFPSKPPTVFLCARDTRLSRQALVGKSSQSKVPTRRAAAVHRPRCRRRPRRSRRGHRRGGRFPQVGRSTARGCRRRPNGGDPRRNGGNVDGRSARSTVCRPICRLDAVGTTRCDVERLDSADSRRTHPAADSALPAADAAATTTSGTPASAGNGVESATAASADGRPGVE